jgi:hypothetical protein
MKSFLVKGKVPILKWGSLPNNIFFQGKVPEGYSLAVNPSEGFVVIDVDNHEGGVNGFENIPGKIHKELQKTFQYATKNNGRHYWIKYTGNKTIRNKASGKGLDSRTNKGYAVIPKVIHESVNYFNNLTEANLFESTDVQRSSSELNKWMEGLFC